ncbi:MAG TPA: hypothetical protein EYN66_09565, partial [Myxococcales bacterium]|nr:hypothetical protein [Myxococcales bacterium]
MFLANTNHPSGTAPSREWLMSLTNAQVAPQVTRNTVLQNTQQTNLDLNPDRAQQKEASAAVGRNSRFGVSDKEVGTDPLLVYLRRIGEVGLLNRKGEQEVAQRIETADRRIFRILLSTELGRRELLDVADQVAEGERPYSEIFPNIHPESKEEHEELRRELERYRKASRDGLDAFLKVERRKNVTEKTFDKALTKLYRTIWNAPGGDRIVRRAINLLYSHLHQYFTAYRDTENAIASGLMTRARLSSRFRRM